jgi:hypothetical protein
MPNFNVKNLDGKDFVEKIRTVNPRGSIVMLNRAWGLYSLIDGETQDVFFGPDMNGQSVGIVTMFVMGVMGAIRDTGIPLTVFNDER